MDEEKKGNDPFYESYRMMDHETMLVFRKEVNEYLDKSRETFNKKIIYAICFSVCYGLIGGVALTLSLLVFR